MPTSRNRSFPADRRMRGLAHVRARMLRHGHPRAQMSALLVVTGGCGFLASWAMLHLGVTAMGVRYPLAVVFAYGSFLLLLRLWLWSMMRHERRRSSMDSSTDSGRRSSSSDGGSWSLPDFSGGGSSGGGGGGSSGGGVPRFGGSGAFSGGGAGGEWAPAPAPVVMPMYTPPAPRPALQGLADAPLRAARGGGGAKGGGGKGFGFLDDLDLDDDSGVVIAIALLALAAAAVVAAAAYVLVVAPALLAEVVVDGIVVSGLYRRVRTIDDRQWLRTALRKTWIPTLLIALLLCIVGFSVQRMVPDALSIGDVWGAAHARHTDPLR
jgi:hypothetical protein